MEKLSSLLAKAKIYSYEEYKNMVCEYADKKQCSGEQTREHIESTMLAAVRMKRIEKQSEINEKLKKCVQAIPAKTTWVIIAETWCGDGSQSIPVIAKIANLNPKISLKIILRDENPEIMDLFLTDGKRAIPKLLFIRKNAISTWGPRPKKIQDNVENYKKDNPNYIHIDLIKNIHLWYTQDKTSAIQEELTEIITNYYYLYDSNHQKIA